MIRKTVRMEKDILGTREIPGNVYYGIHTLRASENFPVSGYREDPALIIAYARIKLASSRVNQKLGWLDSDIAGAIQQAAQEVISGQMHEFLIVDVFQAGAGTSLNMNMNEVIANRALEILNHVRGDYHHIHPNDHVNMCQSTNDTFPSALHLAALALWTELRPILQQLEESFYQKAREFQVIIKSGRTHLQDAVPVRLGQEFQAYGRAVHRSISNMDKAAEDLRELAIGGTAVGTGINAHPDFQKMVIAELRSLTEMDLRAAADLREAMQSRQAVANVSGALRGLALELIRIANDLRLLASGPATGIGEIELPAVQPGSSIMPAKINPVMAECLNMIAFQIIGNDTALAMAVQAGQLELNVMMPLMAFTLLQSFRLLINYLPVFEKKCIAGISAKKERCERYAFTSAGLGTVLAPLLGYARTAELIQKSLDQKISIPELIRQEKLLPEEKLAQLFNPEQLTGE